MGFPQGLTRSKSVGKPRTFGEKSEGMYSVGTSMRLVRMSLLRGPKVRKELPALAAQLRAFSSLLSLPSQAQSVIKAFRRQGIGFADVVNTARFFLSRLESLFASQKVFQIFRGRAGLVRCASQRRDCVIYSVPLPLLSINPTDSPIPASALWRSSFLV